MSPAATTGADVHPFSGASMIAHRRVPRATIDSRPRGSRGGAPPGRGDSGTRNQPPTRPRITIGTLTRKIDPHEKWASSTPPLIGPRPMPRADTPAQMPIALPRSWWSVKTFVSTDRVDGMMNAPPTPITQRVTISADADPAKAEAREPTPNTMSPKASAL